MGIAPDTFNLEVIAPYVENTEDAVTVGVVEALRPRTTRVLLPRLPEGTVACSKEYYDAVHALPRVAWGELPNSVIAWSEEDAGHRFVHAKVYRLFSAEQELLLVGSPNLTKAAHSQARQGNFETAIFVDVSDRHRKPGWWLRVLEEEPQKPELRFRARGYRRWPRRLRTYADVRVGSPSPPLFLGGGT